MTKQFVIVTRCTATVEEYWAVQADSEEQARDLFDDGKATFVSEEVRDEENR